MTDTTEPQTLEEAVYKFARFNPYGTNTPWVRGFIEGAKWGASFALDAEISDSEKDAMHNAYDIKCTDCHREDQTCYTHLALAFLAARKKRLGL